MASLGYTEVFISLSFSLLLIRFLRRNWNLPIDWPLLGMSPTLLTNFRFGHDKITQVLERNNGTFVLKGPWFTHTDKLITCDLANANHILSTNFSNYVKGEENKRIFEVMGDFLFNADHYEWSFHRKMLRGFFSDPRYVHSTMKQDKINLEKGLIPVLDHAASQGLLVDLQDVLNRFLLDSSCALVTGYNPGSLAIGFPEIPLVEAVEVATNTVFHRFFLPEWLWTLLKKLDFGQERKNRVAMNKLDDIAEEYIRKKKEDIELDIESFDALNFFLTRDEYRGSNALPHSILRDIVWLLITAGRDSVASTLSWFFWLVSKNRHIVSNIRDEIDEKFHVFSPEELNKLPYLHATFCETLRLYPPTYQVRVPVKSDTLPSGNFVNPKTKIIFSSYALGRMSSVWGNDCLEFKPERWISEKGEFRNDLVTKQLLSFSNGPRICPGKSDAFVRMKVIASAIIYNYNVEIDEGHPIAPALSVILSLDPGLMVRITKRWA